MNILDALNKLKEGVSIRGNVNGVIYFILQTNIEPYQIKGYDIISLNDVMDMSKKPNALADLPYETADKICIEAVECLDYTCCSNDDIFSESIKAWEEENKDKYEE